MSAQSTTEEGQRKKTFDLLRMLVVGALVGAGFNLAFGSVPWKLEGILGGLVSAVCICIFS